MPTDTFEQRCGICAEVVMVRVHRLSDEELHAAHTKDHPHLDFTPARSGWLDLVVAFLVGIGTAVFVLILSGCATTPTLPNFVPDDLKTPSQIIADIKARKVEIDEFTYRDLVRAGEIAAEAPVDQVALACFPKLAAKVRARLDTPKGIQAIGAFSVFEKVNKVVFNFSAPDDSLAIACDALAKRTLVKIIEIDLKIAALVATFGASGVGDLPKIKDGAKGLLSLLHELGVSLG